MNDIIKELYAPLKQKMYFLFSKYHVNIALSMDLEVKIRDEFKQKLLNPISIELQQRVSDEKKVMHSIRRSLDDRQQSDLILRRTADDMNTFYLGNRKEFNEKSKAFMNETDIYELQVIIAERHDDTEWQNDIHRMIESMNSILRRIFEKKNIDDDVLQRLTIDISLIKIPFLYFLPHISRNNQVSVVPIISVYESPTWKLGLFLDRLIRPVARRSMQLTAFIDEIDVVQKLRYFFCKRQQLTSNTLFATIDVTNYYTNGWRRINRTVLFCSDLCQFMSDLFNLSLVGILIQFSTKHRPFINVNSCNYFLTNDINGWSNCYNFQRQLFL